METNLIQVKENETVTTSLMVAEKFNKNHKEVLRKIGLLISQIEDGAILPSPHLFRKSEYITLQNKTAPMYYLNRDGFTLLAMGFTGKESLEWKLKYIEAFNQMEEKLRENTSLDTRFEIAKLIVKAPESKLSAIKQLYPEYFAMSPDRGSLEYISDVNTSYLKWKEDYNIDKDWIGSFPTIDIFNNYMRYCVENRFPSLGKKSFYKILEDDFYMERKQRADGHRYFISA